VLLFIYIYITLMITFGSFIQLYMPIYTLYILDFTTAIVYISLMFSLQFAVAVSSLILFV